MSTQAPKADRIAEAERRLASVARRVARYRESPPLPFQRLQLAKTWTEDAAAYPGAGIDLPIVFLDADETPRSADAQTSATVLGGCYLPRDTPVVVGKVKDRWYIAPPGCGGCSCNSLLDNFLPDGDSSWGADAATPWVVAEQMDGNLLLKTGSPDSVGNRPDDPGGTRPPNPPRDGSQGGFVRRRLCCPSNKSLLVRTEMLTADAPQWEEGTFGVQVNEGTSVWLTRTATQYEYNVNGTRTALTGAPTPDDDHALSIQLDPDNADTRVSWYIDGTKYHSEVISGSRIDGPFAYLGGEANSTAPANSVFAVYDTFLGGCYCGCDAGVDPGFLEIEGILLQGDATIVSQQFNNVTIRMNETGIATIAFTHTRMDLSTTYDGNRYYFDITNTFVPFNSLTPLMFAGIGDIEEQGGLYVGGENYIEESVRDAASQQHFPSINVDRETGWVDINEPHNQQLITHADYFNGNDNRILIRIEAVDSVTPYADVDVTVRDSNSYPTNNPNNFFCRCTGPSIKSQSAQEEWELPEGNPYFEWALDREVIANNEIDLTNPVAFAQFDNSLPPTRGLGTLTAETTIRGALFGGSNQFDSPMSYERNITGQTFNDQARIFAPVIGPDSSPYWYYTDAGDNHPYSDGDTIRIVLDFDASEAFLTMGSRTFGPYTLTPWRPMPDRKCFGRFKLQGGIFTPLTWSWE